MSDLLLSANAAVCLFLYCPVCMNIMVYSLAFRRKERFVFSCFLWMMSPDLTTSRSSPKVSLIEPRVAEKLQV